MKMTGPLNSKLLRFGTLGLLYFVQGAPYGFQTACLPLILRQAGFSFTGKYFKYLESCF